MIGGQLFSKSLRGLTVYKMQLLGMEGVLTAIGILILPFLILGVLILLSAYFFRYNFIQE